MVAFIFKHISFFDDNFFESGKPINFIGTESDENLSYLLIGNGRWGTSAPSGGIPVRWQQISGAKVIVEAPVEQAYVEMNQGSYFFNNFITIMVFCFPMLQGELGKFDQDWLARKKIIEEKRFVKHIRVEN